MFYGTVAFVILLCYLLFCIWLENDTGGVEWGNVYSRFAPIALAYLCAQAFTLVSLVYKFTASCG